MRREPVGGPHFEAGPVSDEGWYLDPYGRHEQRWFTSGHPTALIRNGAVDGNDPPPGPLPHKPVPIADAIGDAADLRRADDLEANSYSAPEFFRSDRAVPDHEEVEEAEEVGAEGTLD
jgi:hypothetical protein